ncbi:MAG: hypothetical protein ACLSHU_03640 [Oscillospiraceae bacterium]
MENWQVCLPPGGIGPGCAGLPDGETIAGGNARPSTLMYDLISQAYSHGLLHLAKHPGAAWRR